MSSQVIPLPPPHRSSLMQKSLLETKKQAPLSENGTVNSHSSKPTVVAQRRENAEEIEAIEGIDDTGGDDCVGCLPENVMVVTMGFNGTVFAYGQNSSRKTFTMNGSESDPGIIQRAVKDVFDIIQQVIESKSKEMDSSKGYSSSGAICVSFLNLVDLAGSERIAKTGADGVRLKEGKTHQQELDGSW